MTSLAATLPLLTEAALEHVSSGRPYDAHELWEAAWLACDPGPLREVLRGLIQRCAAAHNVQRGSADPRHLEASRRQLRRSDERLRGWELWRTELGLNSAEWLDATAVGEPRWPVSTRACRLSLDVLLIAGGHGRRAGGPKALKQIDGVPLWRWQVRRLQQLGACHVAVALHPTASIDDPPEGTSLLHVDPDAPMMSSIQAALRARRGSSGPVYVLPVDCPCPPRAVWVALGAEVARAELSHRRYEAARPVVHTPHGRRAGHPIVMHAELAERLSKMDAATARLDLILRASEDVIDVEVSSPEILANYNLDGLSR